MSKYLQDLISGPLDRYRTKTSFNWKKLKVFLETEEIVQYQNKLYKIIENHPLFTTHKLSTKSVDEQRQITFQSACQLLQIEEISWPYMLLELRRPAAMTRVLVSTTMDSFLKQLLSNSMFLSAIRGMGTARHQQFIDDAENQKILGSYCLTEIGHGSNTKGMRTTATYDKRKKVFILNSPNFEDAKCWAGGLGQAAMYGIVYAQLVIDNTYYGLHAFVVPFRDPQTLLPYPGLEIGDMGLKIGLNGLDNGFVRFMNYEIPRVNLLNKLADVTEDGRYVTPIKDPSKRHGAGLGILSGGRVNIGCIIDALSANALTIAIRYAAVRKQFGPENQAEVPILEYQSHQLRLLPYLAATYVFRIFNDFMSEHFYKFSLNTMSGNPGSDAAALGMEIHGISSASKPVIGWIVKEAIQECREACGGHGYLYAARLGDIRNEADPALTYEGENHVLIQQTINWLLKLAPQVLEGKYVFSPLGSTNFLTNGLSILKNSRFTARSVDELRCPQSILKIFQWIVTFLLKTTYEKLEEELKSGKSLFIARNNTQVYYGKSLAMAFIQHFCLQKMLEKISESKDPAIKAVLTRLFSLFGLWAIDKWHMATLYKGEFATGPIPATLIQEAILKLCADLKDDAVALVDVIAVPDFILRSVLGASDGNVYQHLQDSMVKDEYNMNRPTWWKDIVAFTQKNAAVSKL